MAYATRNLSVLAYANGFTLWHYETADGAAALAGFGYFDQAADLFRRGDIVIATTADGASLLSVASCDGERVRVGALAASAAVPAPAVAA
ncbi:MAG: hypothetical protein JNL66_13440 [Alphaproteobacteria bacterium]|nr:hypothetical protein [Alphaproteobacteria bacterium]